MEIHLCPRHFLNTLRDYGYGIRCEPNEYGHALHIIAERVMANPNCEIKFVIAADEICRPYRHLRADESCDDTMTVVNEKISKQAYNDALDRRLWLYLELEKSNRMKAREFFRLVLQWFDGIEDICTLPRKKRRIENAGYRKHSGNWGSEKTEAVFKTASGYQTASVCGKGICRLWSKRPIWNMRTNL
jgi:hypothetical protein